MIMAGVRAIDRDKNDEIDIYLVEYTNRAYYFSFDSVTKYLWSFCFNQTCNRMKICVCLYWETVDYLTLLKWKQVKA